MSARPARTGVRPTPKRQPQNAQLILVGIVVAVLIVFVAVIVLANRQSDQAAAGKGNFAQVAQEKTADGYWVIGDPAAKFTLIEFANFSCSHCIDYHAKLTPFIDKYVRTGQVRYMYVPLVWNYSNSTEAAKGALCAGEQGRFWDMHDALFTNVKSSGYNAYSIESIRQTATKFDLDLNKLTNCILSDDMLPTLQAAAQYSSSVGITGTPAMMWSIDGGKTANFFRFPGSTEDIRGGELDTRLIESKIAEVG